MSEHDHTEAGQPSTPPWQTPNQACDSDVDAKGRTTPPRKGPSVWQPVLVLLLAGVLLYSVSFNPTFVHQQIYIEILRGLGVGTVVFALTSYLHADLSTKSLERHLERVQKRLETITAEYKILLQNQLRDTFELIKSAKEGGIERIYSQRAGPNNPGAVAAFQKRIEHEFEEASRRAHVREGDIQTIRMMGVSLRQYFDNTGNLYSVAEPALSDDKIEYEVLLLDPLCAQAGLRSERESQTRDQEEYSDVTQHFRSSLFQDLQKTTSTLLRKMDKPNGVKARFYRTSPSCFLIFINDSVFVETYHYGQSGIGGLAGGKVPVLEFRKGTLTYDELLGHFQHVWFKARQNPLDQESAATIIDHFRELKVIEELKREFFWIK